MTTSTHSPLTTHHSRIGAQFDLFACVLFLTLIALLPFHAFFRTWLTHLFTDSTVDAISRGGLFIAVWKEILLVTALGLVTLKSLIERKLPFRFLPLDWAILALFVIGLSTKFTSEIPLAQWLWGIRTDFVFYGMYIIGRSVMWSDTRIKLLFKTLLISSGIVIAFGLLLKFVLPADTLTYFGYSPYVSSYIDSKPIPVYHCEFVGETCIPRLASTLSGPNQYGSYLLIVIGLLIALLRKPRTKLTATLLLGIGTVLSLYFTYSQGAWVGLFGLLLVLGFTFVKYTRVFLRDVAFVGVGLVVLILAVRPWIYLNQIEDPSTIAHITKFRDGINVIAAHPLGLGLGGAGPVSERFYGDQQGIISESWYLQMGQEMGILGGLLFIAIVVLIFYTLWKRLRVATNPLVQKLLLITLISFSGISLIAIVLHAWADSTTSWIMLGLIGASIAAADQQRTTRVLRTPGVAAFSGHSGTGF